AQARFEGQGDGHEQTAGIPTDNGSNPDRKFQGRVPDAVSKGGEATFPSDIWVQLRGGTDGMAGSFCIDDDNTQPNDSDTDCGGSSGYDESQWWIRVGGTTEPTGVIQQVGAQARFGVAVFNNSSTNDGLRVLTGIGHKQAINFTGSTLETFNTNTAAMIDSIGEAFPATNTPLAETLYEAARYVAQINSEYYSSSYVYPIAYSGGVSNGVAFQGTGVGSYGGGEEKVLTGTETCPAGYITTACGRDPYFFGSNHTPVWSASSKQVRCCKTFIVLLTDGEPTQDRNFTGNSGGTCSAGNLCNYARDNASAYDGSLCTGNRGVPYVDPPGATCNNDPATPNNVLLKQHRTDYGSNGSHYLDDVAYWAHRNDLRPCSGTSDTTIAVLGVTGHCLDGMQNLTIYTFYAFGNIAARELLMHTAMLGAFEDSNGNNVPDLTSEWDKVNNDTGAVGADGRPDAYFESSNVEDLQDRLLATISAIIRKSSSGAAVSVIATSSTGEGALYQAYFYPSTLETATNNDVKWTG
ncbi:MAG TPA: hypothetical protein VH681_08830, partial [Nitrospiraceae bacterium]